MARLLDKLQWRPLQLYLRHYRSAEIDISSIAVAYYLILTVFPLIVIAANVFPYLNIDTTDLLKFMNEHLPKQFYAPAANVVQDIFSTPSGQLLGVASLTGFWTMIKSLSSLQKAINKVYGASEHRDVFITAHLCTNAVHDYSVGPSSCQSDLSYWFQDDPAYSK